MVKIASFLAIVMVVATSFCRGDSVLVAEKNSDGRSIETKHYGTLVEIRQDIVLFWPEGSAQTRLPASDVLFVSLSTTQPRIAQWTDDNGKTTLLMAIARDGKLVFSDDAGKNVVIPPLKKGSNAHVRIYPAFEKILRLDVPYVSAKPGFIAEAAVEMATTFAKTPITQDQVNRAGGFNGKPGMRSDDLEHALDKLHIFFDPETRQFEMATEPDSHLFNVIKLIAQLSQNRPIFIGLGDRSEGRHNHDSWDCTGFLLMIGVDFTKNEFIFYDPAKSFAKDGNTDASMRMTFDEYFTKRANKQSVAFTLIFTPPLKPNTDKGPTNGDAGLDTPTKSKPPGFDRFDTAGAALKAY